MGYLDELKLEMHLCEEKRGPVVKLNDGPLPPQVLSHEELAALELAAGDLVGKQAELNRAAAEAVRSAISC